MLEAVDELSQVVPPHGLQVGTGWGRAQGRGLRQASCDARQRVGTNGKAGETLVRVVPPRSLQMRAGWGSRQQMS